MEKANTRNRNNWKEFEMESNLYRVEPIVKTTLSWMNFEDVGNVKLGKPIDLGQLAGRRLYAKYVRKHDTSYWKLFIENSGTMNIIYVNTFTLNPVGKK